MRIPLLRSRKSPLSLGIVAGLLLSGWVTAGPASAGTRARYRMLPADKHQAPPLGWVEFTYLAAPKDVTGTTWQLGAFRNGEDNVALFELRCVTRQDPLAAGETPLEVLRYSLHVPATEEMFDYRSAVTGRALLPMWHEFERHFFPRPVRSTGYKGRFPHTCAYLGHVLSLRDVVEDTSTASWDQCEVLALDNELLIGTGRVVKDSEGHRLSQEPERKNYTYVPFTREDYSRMIDEGLNTFALVPGVESYLRSQPVFYRRDHRGAPPLTWPVDFYRSNYRGTLMYEDEPACILVGDEAFHRESRYFSDATALLGKRVRARYLPKARALEQALRGLGVSFGDMHLTQLDYAVWETRYETAWYQLEAGFAGFVHEGRYDLEDFYESGVGFDDYVRASTGLDRRHTAEEMLRYQFAFLRGAARHFRKYWGISIYGQADPEVSPLAVKLAYDMGARYIWFWTSDHGHHLPWNEQLELARIVRQHAMEHPRGSILAEPPVLDLAIVVPHGFFPVLESPTGRRNPWDLWWVRELDREGTSEASQKFRRRMRSLLSEVHEAFDSKEDFDITVADGREIRGYRRVVFIEDPDAH